MKKTEQTQKEVGKFIDPKKIIEQLDIKSGSAVADFGCGPGYFTVPFAKAVGETGKVYALDVLPQALETVAGKMKNFAVSNIITLRANVEKNNGSKLESDSMDWVVLKDVLFQNKRKDDVIAEARRVLKQGGKAVVVEWEKSGSAIGPDKKMRISCDDLKKMFVEQKFSIEKDIDVGSFHYAFVAVK